LARDLLGGRVIGRGQQLEGRNYFMSQSSQFRKWSIKQQSRKQQASQLMQITFQFQKHFLLSIYTP
jgi:hypothetical protein